VLTARALLSTASADERALISRDRAARADLQAAQSDLAALEIELGERDRARSPIWLRMLTVAVILAAVAAIAGGYRYATADRGFSDADYQDAARERVELLLTPAADDAAGRGRKILAGSTGTFRDEFAQSADAYTAFVQKIGAQASGTVDGVGISSRSGERVTLLVTAAITTRTQLTEELPAGAGEADKRRFRIQVDILPEDGSLKISDLEFFP
jgi:Mce-associated membrane protein